MCMTVPLHYNIWVGIFLNTGIFIYVIGKHFWRKGRRNSEFLSTFIQLAISQNFGHAHRFFRKCTGLNFLTTTITVVRKLYDIVMSCKVQIIWNRIWEFSFVPNQCARISKLQKAVTGYLTTDWTFHMHWCAKGMHVT